jgi:DNA-directed RNA polymerase sigma subunit (sigma70/sigma32)
VSLDAPIGDSETRLGALIPAAAAVEDVDYEAISAVLSSLTPQERRVLMLRFGLDGGDPQTRASTALLLRLDRAIVRRHELRGLHKLRLKPEVRDLAAA